MKEKLNMLTIQDDYYYVFELLFDECQNKSYVLNIIINNYLSKIKDYELFYMDLMDYFADDLEYIEKFMSANLENIINHLSVTNLLNYKAKSDKEKLLIRKRLNSNYDYNLECICKEKIFEELRIKYDSIYLNFLKYLCTDLLRYERKNISDIKCIDGCVSRCLIIGDKVLKVGRRSTFNISDDKRYLRPILRKEILIGNEKICIEITERANLNVNENDLDFIMEELKKKGKDWQDASIDNIGRLIKPNIVHYNYSVSDNGYIKNNETDIILLENDIVIIDNDHIYDKVYTKK